MTDRLNLPSRYRCILEALLREHVPNAEVWAYGSRVTGESHDGSDLDLVVRGPELKPLGDGFFGLLDAIEKSNIPILIQAHDWAMPPESFHAEIEREYLVLQEGKTDITQGEWITCTLADACSAIDYGLTASASDSPHGPKFLRITDIVSGQLNWNSVPHVEADDGIVAKYRLYNGDIVIARTGASTGASAYIQDPPNSVFASYLVRLQARPQFDARFIGYFLKSKQFGNYISGVLGDKSAQPNASASTMTAAPFSAPKDRAEQRAIAHVLGTLDDKIELNQRMNETLEEMARALFKSWFVDFLPVRAKQRARTQTGDPVRANAAARTPPQGGSDWTVERARAYLDSMDKSVVDLFPDRLVDSELGEIPEGWEVGKLSDIVTRLTSNENPGLSPSTEFSHFSIPAYDEGQLPKRELGKEIKSSKSRVPQNVVLLSKLNPEIERVWLADALPTEKAICSTEFLVLLARPPFTRSYVYFIARSPLFREQMKSLVTGTSKSHQRSPANAVLSIDTVLPSQEIAEAFELSASRVLRRVLDNRKESRTLATLRDALMPKLVSGEMRICQGHKNRTRKK